jgi:hypothetical protein
MATQHPPEPDAAALVFGLFVPMGSPPDPCPPGRWLFLLDRYIAHEIETPIPLPRRVFLEVAEATLQLRLAEQKEEARHVAAGRN